MGIVYYSGYRDVGPSKVGQSYPDFTACWSAMMGIFAALRHMRRTGRGQHIDDGMYQIGVALVPEPILAYQVDGTDWGRIGNRDRVNAPSGVYPASGTDRWVALTIDSDSKWKRLLEIMGRSDLIEDARFETVLARHENHDEIDKIVTGWTSQHDAGDIMTQLQSEGIAAAAVMDACDLMYDEHLLERKFYELADFGDEGARPLIGRPYKMRNTPIHIKRRGPDFGEANMYVLKDLLGMDDEAIQKLYEAGIVRDDPVNPPTPGAGGGGGRPAKVDEEYREKLARAYGFALPETETVGTEVK
jgi:benzylsuccinate CoA-transferase BbsF subunit